MKVDRVDSSDKKASVAGEETENRSRRRELVKGGKEEGVTMEAYTRGAL